MQLIESHVILECPLVSDLGQKCKILDFTARTKAEGPIANSRLLRAFLEKMGLRVSR